MRYSISEYLSGGIAWQKKVSFEATKDVVIKLINLVIMENKRRVLLESLTLKFLKNNQKIVANS